MIATSDEPPRRHAARAIPAAAAGAAPRNRIDYVDGLRAVAVLAVIVHHVVGHRGHDGGLGVHIADEGAHGVDLFFVLSGFCLAYPTLVKLRSGSSALFDAVQFGAKRLVRIVPPYYIATALTALGLIAVPWALHPGRPIPWTMLDIVQAMLFLDGDVKLLNGAFWTLMVEFRWYFFFPFALMLWVKSPRAFLALTGASVLVYTFTRARGLDLGTLPGFMLGIVAADLSLMPYGKNRCADVARRWALPLAAVFAAIGIACEPFAMIPGGAYAADVRFPYQPTILGWQVAMFFGVVAAGELGALRSVLSHRALVATGVASYGIYLAHQPVIEAIENRYAGPVSAWAALFVAVLAGFAFWAVAERPFTTGRLRAPLVRATSVVLERIFRFLGVPQRYVARVTRDITPDEPALPRERDTAHASSAV